MPKLRADQNPKLSHLKKSARGRVRLPGQRARYLGGRGSWPAEQKEPPLAIRQEYDRVIAVWRGQRAAGVEDRPPGSRLLVTELLEAYLLHAREWYTKRGRPTTEVSTAKQAFDYLRRQHGLEAADDFTAPKLVLLRDEMARTLCRSTVNGYLSRIRKAWGWGTERGLVKAETWWNLRAVSRIPKGRGKARKKVKPIPKVWIERTARQLPRPFAAILRLQLVTAMRPIEACGVRRSVLRRGGRVWYYDVPAEQNKLAHHELPRVVRLGPKAQAILQPWLRAAAREGREHLFDWKGEEITSKQYRERLRRAAKSAGLREWGANRLRHNAGTEIRAKHGIEAAQIILGHAHVSTSEIYAEPNEALGDRVARGR